MALYYEDLYNATGPLRQSTLGQLQSIIGGQTPPLAVPGTVPLLQSIRGQGQRLRQEAMSSMPRGGLLAKTIGSDIPQWEATSQTNLEQAILKDAWNRAQQIGWGGSQGLAGMNISAERQRQQGQNQTVGNIATGLGLLASILNMF